MVVVDRLNEKLRKSFDGFTLSAKLNRQFMGRPSS